MVLVLKHWKSRSSPGIIADGRGINPFTISKSRCRVSRAAAFSSLAHAGGRTHGAAGWSSPVARQAHNLKVVGSNPTPATKIIIYYRYLATSVLRRLFVSKIIAAFIATFKLSMNPVP